MNNSINYASFIDPGAEAPAVDLFATNAQQTPNTPGAEQSLPQQAPERPANIQPHPVSG